MTHPQAKRWLWLAVILTLMVASVIFGLQAAKAQVPPSSTPPAAPSALPNWSQRKANDDHSAHRRNMNCNVERV